MARCVQSSKDGLRYWPVETDDSHGPTDSLEPDEPHEPFETQAALLRLASAQILLSECPLELPSDSQVGLPWRNITPPTFSSQEPAFGLHQIVFQCIGLGNTGGIWGNSLQRG